MLLTVSTKMEVLFLLIGIAIGIIVTLSRIAYSNYVITKRMILSARETLDELKKRVIPCRLEFDNDVIYMYRRDNALFLGKAENFTELEDNLKKLYPDLLFDVDREEIDEARVISKLNERRLKEIG